MDKITRFFHKRLTRFAVLLLIPILTIINFSHHSWVKTENVISWDIKSYYAYLPATFIHKDLSLDFIKENPNEYNKWFWPVETKIGKKCIVTSMGLSFLYSPFFLLGHTVARLSPYEANGYSEPYAMALVFSAMLYVILGFWFLRKLLLKYFDELTVFLTIVIVFIGTNLLYYSSWSAPMPHSYNFGLISIYIYLIDKWHERISYKKTVMLGLLSGLIILIRPTNILIFILLFFWNTRTLKDISNRILFFVESYKHILIMLVAFIIVWTPQFIYWKYVSGDFLYFSYDELGAKFFWNSPQVKEILFSFRKGWWIYTPIMLVSTLGIIPMLKKLPEKTIAISLFLVLNIYVQSSWWCWWFGGSFGQRAFIDSYGIMAIPLASIIASQKQKRWKGIPILGIIATLTWYNCFQIKQYNHMAIHWWWMSKTSYCKTFLKPHTTAGYWEAIPIPDYKKAKLGIYVSENLISRTIKYKDFNIAPQEIMEQIKAKLKIRNKHIKISEKYDISIDSVLTIEAFNIYEKKWSIDKYVRPLYISKIVDSLKRDSTYLNTNFINWEEFSEKEINDILISEASLELKNIKFE